MERLSAAGSLDSLVPEIIAIDELEDIAAEYARRHGRCPSHLSHWDPGDAFVARIRHDLRIPPLGDAVRYRFTYQLADREKLLTRLGYTGRNRRLIVTENGTSSVLAAASALALNGVTGVVLIEPCYFAAKYALRRFGIEVRSSHWVRRDGRFSLPQLFLGPNDALWLEDPIFNTGCSGLRGSLDTLSKLIEDGHYVVADEALGVSPGQLAPALSEANRYIAIHAPHKAICINGLKFGAVSFDKSLYEVFDQWSDILNGGLSLSAQAALIHFLSPAFDSHVRMVAQEVIQANACLSRIIASFDGKVTLDKATSGYWRTLYIPHLAAQVGENLGWVASLVEATGAIFIPGSRAAFDPAWGFCFRINLLRLGRVEQGALRRLLKALVDQDRSEP